MFKHLDADFPEDDLDALFRQVDLNGDGCVDYAEFVAWLAAGNTLPKEVLAGARPQRPVRPDMQGGRGGPRKRPVVIGVRPDERSVRLPLEIQTDLSREESRASLGSAASMRTLNRSASRLSASRLSICSAGAGSERLSGRPAASSQPSPVVYLEMTIHPGHRGFTLGGRYGDIVTRVHGGPNSKVLLDLCDDGNLMVLLKTGWRAVGFEGEPMSGSEIRSGCCTAQVEKRFYRVTFELSADDDILRRVSQRALKQAASRRELGKLFGRAKTLADIEQMSDAKKEELLKSIRLQVLSVDSAAVLELEVLLGLKSARLMQSVVDINRGAKRGDLESVERILGALPDEERLQVLSQRDGRGNLPIHYANGSDVVNLLLGAGPPDALDIENVQGNVPLLTHVWRHPDDLETAELLSQGPADILRLNKDRICPAMVMYAATGSRTRMEKGLATWQELTNALALPVPQMLEALRELKPGLHRSGESSLSGLLSFHVFGEPAVWQEGKHTDRSRQRLREVWPALRRALEDVLQRSPDATPVARALLEATRGPRNEKLDPRRPYREDLQRCMLRLQERSARELSAVYMRLQEQGGEEVGELLAIPSSETAQPSSDWETLGLRPRLRMPVEPPRWHEDHDMKAAFLDLQKVNMVGQVNERDSAYDLIILGKTIATDHGPHVTEEDVLSASWLAAWIRGVCQSQLEQVSLTVRDALGPSCNGTLKCRREAKGFPRTCEKMMEEIAELVDEFSGARLRGAAGPPDHRAHAMLRSASRFVVDILGCGFIAESAGDLLQAYRQLLCASESDIQTGDRARIRGIRRTKNSFPPNYPTNAGYRDLKVWLEIECPDDAGVAPHLLVEVQLLLEEMFREKHWAHLPYEAMRGSMDWPHLGASWRVAQEEVYHGLSPGMFRIEERVEVAGDASMKPCHDGDIVAFDKGERVNVLEVSAFADDRRIVGRIAEPQAGWIPLVAKEGGKGWASRVGELGNPKCYSLVQQPKQHGARDL